MTSFGFNAITGELDLLGDSGGGGGSISGIAGSSGSPISSGVATIIGMTSGDSETPVMSTSTSVNNLYIENRANLTPYVVSADTTAGSRGTYTTIQSAIDAAVIDGCTIANQKLGMIYAIGSLEGFNIPAGAFISVRGIANSGRDNSLLTGTTITSTVTIEGGASANLEDLTMFVTSGACVYVDEAPASLTINQCALYSTSAYGLDYTADSTPLKITNCSFPGTAKFDTPVASGGYAYIYNTDFNGSVLIQGGSLVEFEYCSLATSIELNGVAVCRLFDCSSNGQFLIFGTSTTTLGACEINNLWAPTASSAPLFNFPGTVVLGNVYYMSPVTGTSRDLSDGTGLVVSTQSLKGNITTSRNITANDSTRNYDTFIWCNHTAAINVYLSPGAANNQEITIKDRTLNASVNNVTISVTDGLIEGQSSFVMDQNGQCVRLKKFGTDYYLI